eukprot:2798160-Pyramimonas_sp.AAC.1
MDRECVIAAKWSARGVGIEELLPETGAISGSTWATSSATGSAARASAAAAQHHDGREAQERWRRTRRWNITARTWARRCRTSRPTQRRTTDAGPLTTRCICWR